MALIRLAIVCALAGVLGACTGWPAAPVTDRSVGAAKGPDSLAKVQAPEFHTVRRGETLYGIAFRYGLDHRRIATWNDLGGDGTIHPGQRLRLAGPQLDPEAPPAVAAEVVPAAPEEPPPVGRSEARPLSREDAAAPVALSEPEATAPAPAPPARAATQEPTRVAAATTPPPPVVRRRPPMPVSQPKIVVNNGWQWPAKGDLIGTFAQGDGTRRGIAIGGSPGQPVVAASSGEVVYSGAGLVGYGELIIVKHSDTLLSAYGHNRKRLVREGQRVTGGEKIAELGESGTSGPKLHFEIRERGVPVDPMRYLPKR